MKENPPEENIHEELKQLLRENIEIAKETNELLHKMYRNDMIGLTIRIIWYVIIIGLPFAFYFYFLEPYFQAFGSNYELFRQGIGEIPGFKGFERLLPTF